MAGSDAASLHDLRAAAFADVPATRANGLVAGRRATWWEHGPRDGRPLLLLHGGGTDEGRLSWGPAFAPLAAAGHRVVAPDLPGYGDTEGFGRPHTVADMAEFVLALADRLGLAQAALAGISMGGATALAAALERPGLARAVVPIASYGVSARAPWGHEGLWAISRLPRTRTPYRLLAASRRLTRRTLRVIYADPTRIDDATVEAVRAACARQARRAAFADFQKGEFGRRGFTTDLSGRLREIDAPVTFLHGHADALVALEAVQAAARAAARPLHVLDAGHWPVRERPEETMAHLLDAIA